MIKPQGLADSTGKQTARQKSGLLLSLLDKIAVFSGEIPAMSTVRVV